MPCQIVFAGLFLLFCFFQIVAGGIALFPLIANFRRVFQQTRGSADRIPTSVFSGQEKAAWGRILPQAAGVFVLQQRFSCKYLQDYSTSGRLNRIISAPNRHADIATNNKVINILSILAPSIPFNRSILIMLLNETKLKI